MNRILGLNILLWSFLLGTVSPVYAVNKHPTIMVSIKPFYNLCAKVMHSVGKPQLLLNQNASPHDYHLKPSDIKMIDSADLIVWGGPELEGYLQKPISNTHEDKNLNLAVLPGLKILATRTSVNWEEDAHDHHDHDHDHHVHTHGVNDPHFWLDPDNATVIVKALAAHLSKLDPKNAKTYNQNAADFVQQLQTKKNAWQQQLAKMKKTPFIVFHDAYQYLEHYFGLSGAGSISLNPEIPPSVKRIQEIQQMLNQQHVRCIFSEPQFNDKIIVSLINGQQIYRGELDPLGQDKDLGPDGYFVLIDNLIKSFAACN